MCPSGCVPRSTYAKGAQHTESLSLAWEDGAWRVVGIVIG